MPEATKTTFKCELCGKKFTHIDPKVAENMARECEQSHDLVLIQLLRSDLNRLLQFIATKEDKLITKTLRQTLRTYARLR